MHLGSSQWRHARDEVLAELDRASNPARGYTTRLAAVRRIVFLRVPRLLAFNEALEVARAPSVAQLAQRPRLDLANTFARDSELLADLFEGVVGLPTDSEAHPQDLLFAWRQRRQFVHDKVAKRALLLVADGSFERNRILDELERLLDLVQRHHHLLGDLFRARLAAQALHQQARHAQQHVDHLGHVDRDTNRPALVGNRTRHRLPNPPRRVSRELEAAPVLELVDCAHQADVAFLDKVEEPKSAVRVTLGEAHHQSQVGFGQLFLSAPALGLARCDRFERERKFLGRNLDPALDLLDRLLRPFDSCGDIEQVLAAAVDLQHMAAVFGLGRFAQKLRLTAAGRLLVTLDQHLRIKCLLEQAAQLADDGLLEMARKLESMQFALDALLETHLQLLEFRLQDRLGPLLELFLEILDPALQRLELGGRGEQLFQLLFIGLGPTLLIVVRTLLVLLEDVTQVGLARLDPSAHLDYKSERNRRTQNLLFDFVLAGFDTLGDFDFLLPRKEPEGTHLPEVETDWIRRLADRISSWRGRVGFYLDLGLEFALRGIRWDVVEDLDIHILEALECRTQGGWRANLLGQETVDLVKSQVALLAPKIDETLEVFPFVLLLHAPKLPYQTGLTTGLSSATRSMHAPATNL